MRDQDKKNSTIKIITITASILAVTGLTAYLSIPRQSTEPPKSSIADSIDSASTPDTKKALAVLFGNEFKNGSIKTADNESATYWFEQTFSIGSQRYHVVFAQVQQLDIETGTPLDSHVQGVGVAAITYHSEPDGWHAIGQQTHIGEIGSWGKAPEVTQAEILTLSESQIALLIDFGYGMGGYFDEGKVLFGFDGSRWRDLGFVQTGSNNAGACDETPSTSGVTIPCWSYTGAISVLPEMHDGYPDLLIKRTGTKSGNDRNPVEPAGNAVYRFDGERYADTAPE
ncbi:MAG: hypothetical protein Kow0065_06470 [Methylomicrobium sp.]